MPSSVRGKTSLSLEATKTTSLALVRLSHTTAPCGSAPSSRQDDKSSIGTFVRDCRLSGREIGILQTRPREIPGFLAFTGGEARAIHPERPEPKEDKSHRNDGETFSFFCSCASRVWLFLPSRFLRRWSRLRDFFPRCLREEQEQRQG